ncbi:MAG: AI-2E family transporter [Alphaproteobacteria bacterium]
MDWSQRTALYVIALGVFVAALYFLREPLTQFAMALILWFSIHTLTLTVKKRLKLPYALALPIIVVVVLGVLALVLFVIINNISALANDAGAYRARLDSLVAQIYAALHIAGSPPTLVDMLRGVDPGTIVAYIGSGLQALASSVVFIFIYLIFLFPAAGMMQRKFVAIFPDSTQRAAAQKVLASISHSMSQYLWVQTVASAITTALTYVCLLFVGLDNALFWAFLIFFLNYIPTIGSIVAVVLPTAFALVQFPTLAPVAGVALGVGVWQFVIGNFVMPRMTGQSLNLSAVVVLLALSIWAAIWGIPGAFLASPITVMLMIVLAQFPSTRWIAILLSADGRPTPQQ